jgi:hypothetical protein
MCLESRAEVRAATQHTRRSPYEPIEIRVGFDGGWETEELDGNRPVVLTVEATNAAEELASWFDDAWWTRIIRLLADHWVTVHIARTPGALLHPVVLHKVDMLRRVMPQWRLVGHAYAGEVSTADAMNQLARSPYHEVRFSDQRRPGALLPDRGTPGPSLAEILIRVRGEQSREDLSMPILVRAPTGD